MTKRISVNNATHTDQAKVAVDANAVEAALAAAHAVTSAHADAEVHAGNAQVADAGVAAKAVADSAPQAVVATEKNGSAAVRERECEVVWILVGAVESTQTNI